MRLSALKICASIFSILIEEAPEKYGGFLICYSVSVVFLLRITSTATVMQMIPETTAATTFHAPASVGMVFLRVGGCLLHKVKYNTHLKKDNFSNIITIYILVTFYHCFRNTAQLRFCTHPYHLLLLYQIFLTSIIFSPGNYFHSFTP